MDKFMNFVVISLLCMTVLSCSSESYELPYDSDDETVEVEHTAVMRLKGGRLAYDKTRATSDEWNHGDLIFLRFYKSDGKSVVCGKAEYNVVDSLWNISYYGDLEEGATYKCEAYYFEQVDIVDNYTIKMTPWSCTYVDSNASYLIDSEEFFVSAVLSPKTARFRVKGTYNNKIGVEGLTYFTSFDLSTNTFVSEVKEIETQFQEDGYTPYIYGSLNATDIILRDTYYEYTKSFQTENFAPGLSGFVTMPTQEVNKGWTSTYFYPEKAVDLGLSVRWSSVNIGADNPHDDGIYCSWGDPKGTNTSTSSSYNQDIYEIAGNPDYDIATNLWNERWQIPTREQWQELIDSCDWEYEYNEQNSLYQYKVTGKTGNSIYLPFYEYISGAKVPTGVSISYGYYWSSTTYSGSYKYEAYLVNLSASSRNVNAREHKYYRMQIRPVLVK